MSGIDTNPLFGDIATPSALPGSDSLSRAGDLMDVLNRQGDQLDTFNDKLSFIANGIFSWDAITGGSGIQSFQHGLNYAPIYLAYYNISTDGNKWYPCDDLRVDSGGLVTFEAYCATDSTYVTGNFLCHTAISSATITIKWFLLREPAQATA